MSSLANTTRVWMIIPTFVPVIGGAQSQVRLLSNSLIAEGWLVTALTRRHCYAHPQGLPARAQVGRLPVHRIFSRGRGGIGSLFYLLCGLGHLAISGRRDIYHAHDTGAAGWLAVVAKTLLGGKAIVKLRSGVLAYERDMSSGLRRTLFKTMLRRADRIHVVNREVAGMLRGLGIGQDRILFLPNPIDTGLYSPVSNQERSSLRNRLGLAPDKVIVLFVGRLERLKGADVLIRAWSHFAKRRPGVAQLVIVGDGPEKESVVRLARELGVIDSIGFAGFREDTRAYYGAADIFVLPSRTEGLSNALREGMACALPAIASNVGGAPDVIQDGCQGLLFESENEAAMAGCLDRLAGDEALRRIMGEQGRRTVVETGGSALIGSLRDAYLELLRGEGLGTTATQQART